MNKLHVIAKVAFGMLGIYLILGSVTAVISSVAMGVQSLQANQSYTMIAMAIHVAVVFGYMLLIYYFLFRRADKFAQKIVGPEESPSPANALAWYPFALRLAMMTAGFLFLQSSLWALQQISHSIRFSFDSVHSGSMMYLYKQVAFFLIYLAISIYLLCGAPQFVRWHIKKTRDLYREKS